MSMKPEFAHLADGVRRVRCRGCGRAYYVTEWQSLSCGTGGFKPLACHYCKAEELEAL